MESCSVVAMECYTVVVCNIIVYTIVRMFIVVMATCLSIHGTLTTHINKAGTDIVRLVIVSREGHTMLIS